APPSSPPPAHPSISSTPPSPVHSAAGGRPVSPHRSFPLSASRSSRFARSASTRSCTLQDRFSSPPRTSFGRGPGTYRRLSLSLHTSCRPARPTFVAEAAAQDRAVDISPRYFLQHVPAL